MKKIIQLMIAVQVSCMGIAQAADVFECTPDMKDTISGSILVIMGKDKVRVKGQNLKYVLARWDLNFTAVIGPRDYSTAQFEEHHGGKRFSYLWMSDGAYPPDEVVWISENLREAGQGELYFQTVQNGCYMYACSHGYGRWECKAIR